VLGQESHSDFVDFSSKGRSQFIKQLEQFITETEKPVEVDEEIISATAAMIVPSTGQSQITGEPGETPITQFEKSDAQEIDLSDDFSEDIFTESPATTSPATESKPVTKIEEMEQVMNSGMQFLSGLFKMSTGKDVGFENQKIEVNKETGEVVMRFKLPV